MVSDDNSLRTSKQKKSDKGNSLAKALTASTNKPVGFANSNKYASTPKPFFELTPNKEEAKRPHPREGKSSVGTAAGRAAVPPMLQLGDLVGPNAANPLLFRIFSGQSGTKKATPVTETATQKTPQKESNPYQALIDGYTDPYAGLISSLRSSGQANDGRLASIYGTAADYIRGMQGDLTGAFDNAAQSYKDSNQAAVNTVNSGYGAARSQLSAMLKALGIEDAAATIVGNGTDMSGDQTAANNRFASILASNLDRNTASQSAALQNLLAQASGTEQAGAQARAMYQQALASQLANLEAQSANSRNSYMTSLASNQAKAEEAAANAPAAISTDQMNQKAQDFLNLVNTQNPNLSDKEAQDAANDLLSKWLKTQGY